MLAYIDCAMRMNRREERVHNARTSITAQFNSKQQNFLNFALSHYVSECVDELEVKELAPLVL